MYIPVHFNEVRDSEIEKIVTSFPLATVVTHGADGLLANHIPLLLETDDDGNKSLIGHIAKANDMHEIVAQSSDVMVIFHAEDAYISPNWYPSKAEHHKVVPTWNYQIVHFHGTITFSDDVKFLRSVVGKLTSLFEQRVNGDKAWKMRDAPRDFLDEQIASIIGLRISVSRCEAKSKMSQNRPVQDRDNVRQKLEADRPVLADAMARIMPDEEKL
ncbi:FMN-binding negative transcriptional regulator [Candidatus Puniceispirillum marinum]|uniref:Negative transcriptional regulator n=1 Tax=Puniceispirillum marinum (strain IMCC1322) TaxID=488538 RepID=D5BR19_PUNMI|nr:FMN-binding negative transcriptional regulator [Candidatus Puniceispirillum marinum]ADE38733.1 Negative transcriptional regulator [Candidatus Puniceispirillum marinum IMCC1322]